MRARFIVIAIFFALLALTTFFFWQSRPQIAATVNGQAIPVSFIERQINLVKEAQPQIFSGSQGAKREHKFRKDALNYLIKMELISQEAKKQHLYPSEKVIDQEIKELKKGFPSAAKFKEALKKQNLTEADLKRLIGYREAEVQMVSWLTKKVKVSDYEIKRYYEKNKDKLVQPEMWRLRHIFIKNKSKAEKVEKQLKNGADFTSLIKRYTEDQSTLGRAGDLGYKSLRQLPLSIRKHLLGLKKGERTALFHILDGYHIFQVDDVIPEHLPAFSEVKDQIKQQLLETKRRAKFSSWLKRLQKQAKIVIKANN